MSCEIIVFVIQFTQDVGGFCGVVTSDRTGAGRRILIERPCRFVIHAGFFDLLGFALVVSFDDVRCNDVSAHGGIGGILFAEFREDALSFRVFAQLRIGSACFIQELRSIGLTRIILVVPFEQLGCALFVFDEELDLGGIPERVYAILKVLIDGFLVVVERQEAVDSRVEVEELLGIDADSVQSIDGFFGIVVLFLNAAVQLHGAVVVLHLCLIISGVVECAIIMFEGWVFVDDANEFCSGFQILLVVEQLEGFLEQSVIFLVLEARIDDFV